MELNLWQGETGEIIIKKTTQTPFRPTRNPHGLTETRTRDASALQGWEKSILPSNPLRHEAASFVLILINTSKSNLNFNINNIFMFDRFFV